MIIAQIVKSTHETGWHLDPGWVIAGLIAIVGYFLVAILNRIVKRQDSQGEVLIDHGKAIVNHDVRIKVVEEKVEK